MTRDWRIFISSLFFVLGFSLVFSLVGILLQTVLSAVSSTVQIWLGYVGGLIIIFFGLYLLGLVKIKFLAREHTIKAGGKFKSTYLTSFLFGAAFATGWTPCVSAALGAILALASTNPSSALGLMLAYSLGIGIPFLLVGLFATQAETFITRLGKWLGYIQIIFGIVLVIIGILIFVGQLSRLANFSFMIDLLSKISLTTSIGGEINSFSLTNIIIAFAAGLGSFLSPCILPLVPGFLAYLAGTTINQRYEKS